MFLCISEFEFEGFSKETSRSMLAMLDVSFVIFNVFIYFQYFIHQFTNLMHIFFSFQQNIILLIYNMPWLIEVVPQIHCRMFRICFAFWA